MRHLCVWFQHLQVKQQHIPLILNYFQNQHLWMSAVGSWCFPSTSIPPYYVFQKERTFGKHTLEVQVSEGNQLSLVSGPLNVNCNTGNMELLAGGVNVSVSSCLLFFFCRWPGSPGDINQSVPLQPVQKAGYGGWEAYLFIYLFLTDYFSYTSSSFIPRKL